MDYLYKYLLIGDSGVGKSSLLLRFANDEFSDTHFHTIGVDFEIRDVHIENDIIRLQIWDTAGHERFKSITSSFYRGARGIILVFDVTDMDSFINVEKWVQEVEKHGGGENTMTLVGNKADLDSKRVVTSEMGKKCADKLGILYMETSAKNSTNVETLFLTMAEEIKIHVKRKLDSTGGGKVIARNISLNNKVSSWKCCC